MVLSKKHLGMLIKEARKLKSQKIGRKYTQEMLAKDLNISRGYIGDIEHGRTYPNYVLLNKISKVCEVPFSFFGESHEDLQYELDYAQTEEYINSEKHKSSPNYLSEMEEQYKTEKLCEENEAEFKKTLNSITEEDMNNALVDCRSDGQNGPLTDDEKAAVKAFLETFRKMKQDRKE